MIKSSKSLTALFILFLCFLFSSRYIQWIIFKKDFIYTPLTKFKLKSNKCKPRNDSILSHYIKNKSNVLFVIIDAFPNKRIYKNLNGNYSKLHKYLIKNSEETIYVSGATQKTFSSLPYLLGKISPLENCRFPFFRGAIKPNIIINNKFISTNKSLCPIIYKANSQNSFIRYQNKLRKIFNPVYEKNLNLALSSCNLNNKKLISQMVNSLNDLYSNENGSINFFHEIQYHSDPKRTRVNGLSYYDEEYTKSIVFLIKKLQQSKNIDELIIMNDHGPRLNQKNFKAKSHKEKIFYDDMYYGVFISRFKISNKINKYSKSNFLVDVIPSSNERYCDNGLGEVKEIKNLSELEYCY